MFFRKKPVINDRSLAYKHIKASPLGEFLPNFECSKDLSIATLTFLSDFNTIEGMISQVIEVTKDGKIDETELEEWEQFKKKGLEFIMFVYSCKYCLGGHPSFYGIMLEFFFG